MGQYVKLDVSKRTETGSRAGKALRNQGLIPAVYYFHGEENINLQLDRKSFLRTLHSGQHVFEVDLDGNQTFVMIKELQYHPVTDEIIHVDLLRVRRSEKMSISVPLVLTGTAHGVKEGGVLNQQLTNIEISCLPTDVPENITYDVSELGINESLHVEVIELGENTDLVTSADLVFVSVQPPVTEVEEPEEVEGEDMLLEGEDGAEGGSEETGSEEDSEES